MQRRAAREASVWGGLGDQSAVGRKAEAEGVTRHARAMVAKLTYQKNESYTQPYVVDDLVVLACVHKRLTLARQLK